ncbi:hypothetical protein LguiB_020282 [Lonicera macranthoides]
MLCFALIFMARTKGSKKNPKGFKSSHSPSNPSPTSPPIKCSRHGGDSSPPPPPRAKEKASLQNPQTLHGRISLRVPEVPSNLFKEEENDSHIKSTSEGSDSDYKGEE